MSRKEYKNLNCKIDKSVSDNWKSSLLIRSFLRRLQSKKH